MIGTSAMESFRPSTLTTEWLVDLTKGIRDGMDKKVQGKGPFYAIYIQSLSPCPLGRVFEIRQGEEPGCFAVTVARDVDDNWWCLCARQNGEEVEAVWFLDSRAIFDFSKSAEVSGLVNRMVRAIAFQHFGNKRGTDE